MAHLKIKMLLFASLVCVCAPGLVGPVAAQSPTPLEPHPVYDTSFEIVLDVVKTGCGGTVTAQTVPPFPASGIQLDVGDTYEITPHDIVAKTPVLNWSGRWGWNESCGKNGRDTCPQEQPRVATSESIYGENVKVVAKQVGGDAAIDQLGLGPLVVVVKKRAILQLGVTVGDFPKPDNPNPGHDAKEIVPFCAAVPAPRVRIAGVTVRIIRRFQ